MSDPRTPASPRLSFGKIPEILPLPDLIAIQRESFEWLITDGLHEVFEEISPIEDFTGQMALTFGEHRFEEPELSVEECREKDHTYSRKLHVQAEFQNRTTGEIKSQSVFMGDFPVMTEQGTFIINGTERVVTSQLVRSPGVIFEQEPDKTLDKVITSCRVIPARGAWLEFDVDKKDTVGVRLDRKRRLPVTVLLRGLGMTEAQIRDRFGHSETMMITLERDHTRTEEDALIEIYRRLRPGEPPSAESGRQLLHGLFFQPKRYDLAKVGRYKLNKKLGLDESHKELTLTVDDVIATVDYLVRLHEGDPSCSTDDQDHFGNRRLRSVGELIQNQVRIGLSRMERVVRERMTTQDAEAITPQTLINIRPVVAAIKEFFGTSQLSQFMDQTNPLAALTHRRRLSALGPGGLSRERAGFEVRDVHPSHYGRMCPIETPEGPNIGLIGSLSTYARINEYGFVETPYRKVVSGRVTEQVDYLTADDEDLYVIAQANAPVDTDGRFAGDRVLVRQGSRSAAVAGQQRSLGSQVTGEMALVPPDEVDYMDVSPRQMVSVATALIPFLEHDDANRALMGANMQRQAVPLLRSESPLVGTGIEGRVAVDAGGVVVATQPGTVEEVSADAVTVRHADGTSRVYRLRKFERSNQGTCINQRPIVAEGQTVAAGDVLADGPCTDTGELALGKNLLVAFMPWEGHNYEDAIIVSERLVKDDVLTSIHIEEHEVDARDTKLGAEEITRDIPNVSEDVLKDLDERGIIRIGAEVAPGDVLVGKVTPKGETELTPEERLLRAIFGEKAREVRDTSLKVPHGENGKVIGVRVFSREAGDDLNPGVNQLVRVYVAQKRKISDGDKLAGRHGNKGVIAKILPEEDMPFLADGTPVDIILNPLGVPSRMNIGQVLETHLGWVAAHGWSFDKLPDWAKTGGWMDGGSHRDDRSNLATPVFDGAAEAAIEDLLMATQGTYQEPATGAERRLVDAEGKAVLFDGRTGEPYATPVTVGYIYILKLLHLVDDKIHARSTGPYSMITQQPLGGKAQFGGQRFGEMEVWALEAYGSAYALQELLTIKSDDVLGRVKVYEAIVKGENIPEPGIPESFKVLIKEMQSLCLNVEVLSAEGQEIEMRETDEDVFRAAEELGIDLSRREPSSVEEV
ncbi:MAG TPA: DNA-directed RNA polymerase subunit beta [Actinomycetes bacterium]|nr:DNA-directed RNA polymerase subunit beta [Actinomycetes bacterium]